MKKQAINPSKTLSPFFAVALTFVLAPISIDTAKAQESATEQEAYAIGLDAYVYGYSLITTEITRVQMSNVPGIEENLHAPMGQFSNVKQYPPADYRGVSAPNADTLYSVAWLDLGEPQVFSHPDIGERF
jgi:hypothetical protein